MRKETGEIERENKVEIEEREWEREPGNPITETVKSIEANFNCNKQTIVLSHTIDMYRSTTDLSQI